MLDPFRYPWIIEGWMRGSHDGPLMPVSMKQATPISTALTNVTRVIPPAVNLNGSPLPGECAIRPQATGRSPSQNGLLAHP